MSRLRLAVAVFAALTVLGAAVRWGTEFGIVASKPSVADMYAIAAEGVPVLPETTSHFAMTLQMTQCDDWMTSVLSGFATVTARQNVAIACEKSADDILASSPTFSLAHLVKAGAARNRADVEGVVQALSHAQMTAPFEGQLATRRLRMLFLAGPDAIAPALEKDVRVVAQSRKFVGFLARYYWAYPERRLWLTEALEGLEPADAKRILGHIRKAAPGSVQ